MKPQKFTRQFAVHYELAQQLASTAEAEALLVLIEGPTDWEALKKGETSGRKVIVAADEPAEVAGAEEAGLPVLILNMEDSPVNEKLTQALLNAVGGDLLTPGSSVVAVYSGFEAGKIDSLSYLRLDEHLGRLTSRDLRSLSTKTPLATLRAVVDLAVEIGREGREGKRVGTMFIIGNVRKVLQESRSAGFDPVRGYTRKERNLLDPRIREGLKEIAQLDGAFVINSDGTVEAACRIVDSTPQNLTLSKGLGSRHWAAAAITRQTTAIAVVVSQSSGTVRIFQNGEVVLRIEPFRRAMKWRDFDYEPPEKESEN